LERIEIVVTFSLQVAARILQSSGGAFSRATSPLATTSSPTCSLVVVLRSRFVNDLASTMSVVVARGRRRLSVGLGRFLVETLAESPGSQ